MKFLRFGSYCAILAFLMCSGGVFAAVDPAAAVVKVRKDCTENGVTLANCFTNMAVLTDWMANTRKPNADNPLQVYIGPGVFMEQLLIQCDPANGYMGYTAFNGAGNGQTIIKASDTPVSVTSCTELSFSHLAINGFSYGGIQWDGGGTSRWNDVNVIGVARSWYEIECGSQRGSHYWFGSKLTASAFSFFAATYEATCDESWFFGSEISVTVPVGANSNTSGGAVIAADNGVIHVYGSVLRALIDGPGAVPIVRVGSIPARPSSGGGEIHIHGTGLDVISSTGRNITALLASANGMIHANASAYNMSTTGTKKRIVNTGGHVHASYLWQEDTEAPSITSVNGADMAVVTNTSDGQPHLVIYSSNCTSKWFDTVTKACR